MGKIGFQTKLSVNFLREGKRFIAYSPALDLSTSGKTYEEAKRRFQEAAQLFFEETMKKGVLKDVLRDLGWQFKNSELFPPVSVGNEVQSFKIPVRI